jgi:LDH2 family malate/lactate/ureidoglycolate dehydrogenase
MAADRIHLSVAEAREHSERALRGIGYDAEEARIIADHAIDAALCGYEYSGLAKLLNIPEHRRFKRPRSAMKVLRETELSSLYDAGNSVGMLLMYHAACAAIDKATTRQPGVGEIRIPGERAFRSREQALRDGIEIDRVVYEALKTLPLTSGRD